MAETSDSEYRADARLVRQDEAAITRDAFAEADLSSIFPEFAGGRPILWGAVIAVGSPGPATTEAIRGVGWSVVFQIEPYEFPLGDSEGEFQTHIVEGPVAIVSVETGTDDLNAARDIGRPLLRALIGLMSIRSDLLMGGAVEWEGAVQPIDGVSVRTATARRRTHLSVGTELLDELREALAGVDLAAVEDRHRLGLEWVSEAWSAATPALQLTDLWFAVVVVVDSTYSRERLQEITQMERVEEYLLGLPISEARREALYGILEHSYGLRNRVVHRGERASVALEDVEQLFGAVREFLMVDIERS